MKRDHEFRIPYLKTLRKVIEKQASKDIIYVDESGFESHTFRPFAWSVRGKKSYGERRGTRGIRTNLIATKRGKEMLTPVLYQTSTTA